MTPKQFLDSFSETLMHDDRILSSRERELLAAILHQARPAAPGDEAQSEISTIISRAVGETVAQRAFTVLGSSIVERLVKAPTASALSSETEAWGGDVTQNRPEMSPGQPQPPSPGQPQPPAMPRPPREPQPPSH